MCYETLILMLTLLTVWILLITNSLKSLFSSQVDQNKIASLLEEALNQAVVAPSTNVAATSWVHSPFVSQFSVTVPAEWLFTFLTFYFSALRWTGGPAFATWQLGLAPAENRMKEAGIVDGWMDGCFILISLKGRITAGVGFFFSPRHLKDSDFPQSHAHTKRRLQPKAKESTVTDFTLFVLKVRKRICI